MAVDDLALLDEHEVDVAAPVDATWDALFDLVHDVSSGRGGRILARVLGCDPNRTDGWDEPGIGTTVPGFRIVAVERPRRLVVEGRHRFSRYGIVFHVEPTVDGSRFRLKSRADFPGVHGRLYRLGLLGTGGHVLAVRRMLLSVRRRAEESVTA